MNQFALVTFLVAAISGSAAVAQDAPAPAEGAGEPISTLMFFTLGAVLALAIGAFLVFLRSRSNRKAADRALNSNHQANN